MFSAGLRESSRALPIVITSLEDYNGISVDQIDKSVLIAYSSRSTAGESVTPAGEMRGPSTGSVS